MNNSILKLVSKGFITSSAPRVDRTVCGNQVYTCASKCLKAAEQVLLKHLQTHKRIKHDV